MNLLLQIKNRKSPLIFQAKKVEPAKIKILIEAARWAPSCFNDQPWKYIIVNKQAKTRPAFEQALNFGNGWAKAAACLVAVAANPKDDCKINDLPYYAYDCGLSVMNFTLEAEHQGLRVHQMAGYNEKKVKKALKIPAKYRVIVVFALGYEADAKKFWDKLTQKIKDRIAEPRTRKPVKENFFFGQFKK